MKRGDAMPPLWVPALPAVTFTHATHCGSMKDIRQKQCIAGTAAEGTTLIAPKQSDVQHSPFLFVLRYC